MTKEKHREPSVSLKRALDLYGKVRGAVGKQEQLTWRYGDSSDETIESALDLDPTEVTARMVVISEMLRDLEVRALPLRALLEGDDKTQAQLDAARELIAHLRSPELNEPVENFRASIREAMKRYGGLDAATAELIDDPVVLATLRLSALQNIARLREFQFTRGDCEPGETPPVYYEQVFEFWNPNSLLSCAARMKAGVMLALVRDPRAEFSYFAFCVRNGANIYLVTDKHDDPHPEYRNRTRKPGREFLRRADAGFFPYGLLDFEANANKKDVAFAKRTDLVPYQEEAHRLGAISGLPPEEKVWIALMLDLLVHRYWIDRRQLRQLSYTGEMIKVPRALLDRTKHLPIVRGDRQLIEVPPLKVGDVLGEKIRSDVAAWTTSGHNKWLEDRYGKAVDELVLNPILDEHRAELWLDHKSLRAREVVPVVEDDPFNDEHNALCEKASTLSVLRPDDFNTKDRLLSDRRWIARQNFATVVKLRAEAEFEREKEKVAKWYAAKVEANLPKLIEAIDLGSLKERGLMGHRGGGFKSGMVEQEHEMLSMSVRGRSYYMDHVREQRGVCLAKRCAGDDRLGFKKPTGCVIRAERSVALAGFSPECAAGLAILAGCKVSDLPVFLRHWLKTEPYAGNSILARVDPFDHIDDPWRELDLAVVVFLSKRALESLGWCLETKVDERGDMRWNRKLGEMTRPMRTEVVRSRSAKIRRR